MNTQEDKGNIFQKGGRYLYADYTPLEQNIDFLSRLKDFATLCDTIFQQHNDFEFLRTVLANAESLESEILSNIDQLSGTVGNILGNFSMKYNEPLRKRYSIPSEADPFVIATSSLKGSIIHSRQVFLKQSDNYRRYIYSRIEDSLTTALQALNELVSKGYEKLPYVMIANLQKGLQISVDETFADSKHYSIIVTNTLPLNSSSTYGETNSISYSLSIRSTEVEFWNQRRKVSDFGLKDIMVPVGLKTPITKKLKRSFDFLPGLDKEPQIQRKPKFVNVDGYYVYSVTTDGKENILLVLVDDPSRPDDNLIRIKYRMSGISHDKDNNNNNAKETATFTNPRPYYLDHNKVPRIDFTSSEEGKVQDILEIKDIAEATDIAQIMLLGRAILDKTYLILHYEPSRLVLYSKLSSIRVDDKDALVVDASKSSISLGTSNIVAYDPSLVTLFLEIIAKYHLPIVRKLKEKSPMKNELILRFENADGSREERSLRIEELQSILKRTDGGKKIASALEIYNGESNIITNAKDTKTSDTR
jgi:hypothetical protein